MSAFSEYIASLKRELGGGAATESSYRPALKTLLEALGESVSATNEPKRTLCGAPDFKITRKTVPLGYLETKDIGTNLDEIEKGIGPHGGQFVRYRDGLPNWVLTDYLDFRWFVKGKKRLSTRIAELDSKGNIKIIGGGEQKLVQLLNTFYREPALTVATARDLATSMAHMTRIVRDLIIDSLKEETEETERLLIREKTSRYGGMPPSHGPWLHNWLNAFRETLIPDLNEVQFADMFAQTLAYGLFAARVHSPAGQAFSREMAAYSLPKTNPFLRKLFAEIAGVDMPDTIAWAVDDIVELLKHADMVEILKDFGKGKGKEDPVVHFYETFLAAYDPKMRELRGVYYTPEPVVSYIVRSIDHLLKTRFNRPKGLADENTLIFDPATGTATFLYFVIDLIHQSFAKQKGAWDDYVSQHLLNRIFGFELLMAPYAVAHLKLGMQLEQTGYKFGSDQRLGIYLTNTLEEVAKKSEQLFASWVAEEANAAAKIKRDLPIMVILGNPPYSNFGRMNRGKWILSLLDDYKHGLHEKKLNIDDDFIKFIRFAQWRIEKTGYGIIGLITNNVYLDGITHRRMRECLMNAFNEIYLLNLHGNLRKKELAPDGTKDENIFDIQQGVTISLFLKNANKLGSRVFYADLWGQHEDKYAALWKHDARDTRWTELKPAAPYFFFVPKKLTGDETYESGWGINEVFSVWQNALKTDRDELFFDFGREELEKRMKIFFSKDYDVNFESKYHVIASSSYDIKARRNGTIFSDVKIKRCLYRPFDKRWLYYDPRLTSRPAEKVMRHMLPEGSLGLLSMRQYEYEVPDYCYFLATRSITECRVFISNRGIASCFPLYLYPETIDEPSLHKDRRPNFTRPFLKILSEKFKLAQEEPYGLPKGITAEDIYHYAYAVFHSATYRKRYAEFLKIDFPRLPLTGNLKLFLTLTVKGRELVALHLLESPEVHNFITSFPEKGDNIVEKVEYTDNNKRVWINKTQYFSGIPKAVWEFHIGGYQVCEKWLKDRRGRKLSYDDIQHYQKVVVALNETICLMAEIDKDIDSFGGWPKAFS